MNDFVFLVKRKITYIAMFHSRRAKQLHLSCILLGHIYIILYLYIRKRWISRCDNLVTTHFVSGMHFEATTDNLSIVHSLYARHTKAWKFEAWYCTLFLLGG